MAVTGQKASGSWRTAMTQKPRPRPPKPPAPPPPEPVDPVRSNNFWPNAPVQPHLRTLARRASIEARSEIADAFAANVRSNIKEIRASGVTSMRASPARWLAVASKLPVVVNDVQVAAIPRR